MSHDFSQSAAIIEVTSRIYGGRTERDGHSLKFALLLKVGDHALPLPGHVFEFVA